MPVVGIDTEFVSEGSYQPILCLLQVAADDGVWLVDPLAGLNLEHLWSALTAPDRDLVALAAREELRFCLRYAGRPPATLFDPQIAAGLLGYGYPLSHTNLVRKVLGAQVEGGEAFTDWRRRPLSKKQLEYAADDVRYLLAVRDRLLDRARRTRRVDWVRAECARLVEAVAQDEDEERWWRVTGGSRLPRRELGVLRELWRWREDTARATDAPPRRVLRDEMLVEIAKRKPGTTNDLFALRGLERSSVRKAGPAIIDAVQAGLRLPEDQLPRLDRHVHDPPQVRVLSQLLSVVSHDLAAQHEVDPALLATTADLQDLVRWHLGGDRGERPRLLEGWRGEILGGPLLDLLTGKSGVRVRDVEAPNPLTVERLPDVH